MIDKAVFNSNYEIFDKEIVSEIITIYIAEYPDRIAKLENLINLGDLDQVYKTAHSLKGVTANFFDKESEELARTIEEKGRAGDSSGLKNLFTKLKASTDKLVAELAKLQKEYS
ncbi:MAG: Hpt domain-containing protein [Bacteroidales bacterium]|jgi:HPt (histidine-containing phosphotransfer) domain-containing protein|nr:Hpt domain-containing protein [Bacteroidales bacterium]